jgi:hypothetical protein
MFRQLVKLLLIIVLLVLSVGYLLEIFDILPAWHTMPAALKLFGGGALAFLGFWMFFRKQLHTFAVFEHELTHVLVAKLFFLKTLHFEVSPRKHIGGQVVVGVDSAGGFTRVISVFFSLAPYYLPTLTLLVFALTPLLGLWPAAFAFAIGFTVMYHIVTTFLEFGFHQADIQRHGEYFSTAFVLLGNLIFLGIALIVVLYGFQHVPAFLISGVLNVIGE